MDEDLIIFIVSAVRSVWSLEILLQLRQWRTRAWTRVELERALHFHAKQVGQTLSLLESVGIVSREREGFIYAPASAALESLCDRLDEAFRERPAAVINAIVASRRDCATTHSDAAWINKPGYRTRK